MNIAFIGLGVMGNPMARHLLEVGHALRVFTRTRVKAEDLLEAGAEWAASPARAAAGAEMVCTMLGYPEDVREVYFGEEGVFAGAKAGTLLIDFTTSSPALARDIAEKAADGGMGVLDAPVSGGDRGAREAALSIMVGGAEADVARGREVLDCLGKNVVHQGPPGSGQTTKLCNQIAIASNMLGVCEALVFARAGGLDPRRVLESIEYGAAGSWSLSNLGPRILDGDLDPGFYVHHFIKDMSLALETAIEEDLELPGLELALNRYRRLAREGGELLGTQGLIRVYD